jgi:glycosyl transferase family 25
MPYPEPNAFFINLDRRKDRLEQIQAEVERAGIVCERFSAIERNPGILGCGLSHLAVLKEAKARSYPSVLILEDDFELTVSPEEFHTTLQEFFALEIPWDVLMISYHINSGAPTEYPMLQKVLDGQTASGYIVNAHFYDTLISLYETAMPLLKSTGRHWDYANDQVWKKIQPTSNWYALTKRQGRQRASYSDNCQKFMDYGI